MASSPNRAKELFLAALELSPAEREAFVASACAGDTTLAARVRGLLEAYSQSDDVLTTSSVTATRSFVEDLEPGSQVGAYRLGRLLGEGGYGTVWLAEQLAPVRRRVALKILKVGLESRAVVARFEAERQALAMMDHPCVARVFDAGTTERGRPYFAMEYVDGAPITDYCERRILGVPARLRLFVEVCRAVQHAHQKGVVHRDLKPSNVLVAELDGRAIPKVIDFGIAKALGVSLTEHTLVTRGGEMIGTPSYMSPEQATGSADVDTRADTYSLGALLYELLTGSPPFTGEDLIEVVRAVREDDPPRPSTRIVPGSTHVMRRDLRGDLDWIVLCCLQKDRERRYESVGALARDVERHLDGEPVQAGPPELGYRVRKLLRRHRAAIGAVVAILLLLVGGTVVSATFAVRASREADRAQDEADRALREARRYEAIAGFLEEMFLSLKPVRAESEGLDLLRGLVVRGAARIDRNPDLPPVVEARLRRTMGRAFMALGSLDRAEPLVTAALAMREEHLGPQHAETLQSLDDVAELMLALGRVDAADGPLSRAVEGRRRTLGEDHPDTLASLGRLGRFRQAQGRFDEALAVLEDVVERRRMLSGLEHDDTVRAMVDLAGVYADVGRAAEARHLLEQALEIQTAMHGDLHRDTLLVLRDLAELLLEVGEVSSALPLMERAFRIEEQVLPAGHPTLLAHMSDMADVCERTGDLAGALAIHDRAVSIAAQHHPGATRRTLLLRYERASVRQRLGELAQARADLEWVWTEARRLTGGDSELAASAAGSMVDVLLEQGDFAGAEAWARRAVEAGSKVLAADDPALGIHRVRLGLTLRATGELEAALAELAEGHRLLAGREAEWTRRATATIVDLLESDGRHEEAERWRARDR